jgi:hypothetical protein
MRPYTNYIYEDKYGDIWRVHLSGGSPYLLRVKDGNIGGWFNGQGLVGRKA